MPVMNVMILRRDQTGAWEFLLPADPSLIRAPDPETAWHVAILEAGMSDGKPSIALAFDLADGSWLVAQTSLEAWLGVTAAFRGAFPEAFRGTIFEAPETLY